MFHNEGMSCQVNNYMGKTYQKIIESSVVLAFFDQGTKIAYWWFSET
jgi:hypothetical protein